MRACDVAIVGAGPAGSSAAITLAKLGLAVMLFDRARFPRHKLCGDFLNPAAWPVLQELGAADAVHRCVHAGVSRFSLISASGRTVAGALPGWHSFPSALGIRRYFLDEALLQQARNRGATVHEATQVTTLLRNDGGWNIRCRAAGSEEIYRARLLIGADGRNSRVARQLNLDSMPPSRASVGFQIRLKLTRETGAELDGNIRLYQFPGGYAGVVRVDPDTINVAFVIERARLRGGSSFEALRDGYLKGNRTLGALLARAEPRGKLHSIWPVYFRPRKRFGDGFLLVGDAAQVTEPLTGEGVYFALRSGQLAAHAAARAFTRSSRFNAELAAFEGACRREFAARARLNACLRALIQHPVLLSGALTAFGQRSGLLDMLLKRVCGGPELPRAAAHAM